MSYAQTHDLLIMMCQEKSTSYHCICVRNGIVYDSLLSMPVSINDFNFERVARVYELEWTRK